jgi:cytochrome bd ubiquinol oxidase subunit II
LFFGAFPRAFAEISIRLHIPLVLMLIGIVFRGTSFVFRTHDRASARRRWGWGFAASSAVTPVLLGIIVGAITRPLPPIHDDAEFWPTFIAPWLNPFAIATGFLALAQFAFLAAVYLTVEARDSELADDFRKRALGSALVLAGLAGWVGAIGVVEAPAIARTLSMSFLSSSLAIATGSIALATVALLWRRHYAAARLCAAAQVTLILLGWGFGMYPYLIAESLTIRAAAAPEPVLVALLVTFLAGLAILSPALVYLLRTFETRGS